MTTRRWLGPLDDDDLEDDFDDDFDDFSGIHPAGLDDDDDEGESDERAEISEQIVIFAPICVGAADQVVVVAVAAQTR